MHTKYPLLQFFRWGGLLNLGLLSLGCSIPKTPHSPSADVISSQKVEETQLPAERKQQPAKSKQMQQSGLVKLGEPLPFFSGWAILEEKSEVLNLTEILKKKRRGYIVTLAASWCAPCLVGLERLGEAKQQFQKADLAVIVLIIDTNDKARELRHQFNLEWTHVIVDQYQAYAKQMTQADSDKSSSSKGLNLPRSFRINSQGVVELIIGEEGDDWIELLLQSSL